MDSHYVGKVSYSMLRRKEKEGKECFPVETIKLTLGAECGDQLKKSYIFQVVPRTADLQRGLHRTGATTDSLLGVL